MLTTKGKEKIVTGIIITAIVLAVSSLLVVMAGKSPIDAFNSFVFGIFGTQNGFAEVFVKATPLIFTGLGICVAFKSGFFNIGAEGQFYMGALAATAVTVLLPDVPGPARIALAMVAAFILGGFWAFIAGILKAKLQISEIITTIMLNYIAINVVAMSIRGWLMEEGYLPQSPMVDSSAQLPIIWEPTRLHAGFILAVIAVVVIWFMINKTTIGYELMVVGENNRAAKCTGISVMKNIIISACLSGGLSGLAGMSEVLGVQHRLLDGISSGCGYTAILIALLAFNKPIGVLGVAIGYGALTVGANTMQRQLGIPVSIVSIIIGVIVLLILGRAMFNRRQIQLNDKGRERSKGMVKGAVKANG